MRIIAKGLALAACVLWLAPSPAVADDVSDQLRMMQDRMSQLEDRLQATDDQLEAANQRSAQQAAVIERAGLEDRPASSGVASFLESLEVGGWVAGSYFYNFDDPNGRDLAGFNTGGFAYPFHPDANSFSLDQLWFELERPVSEDSRAGFRADIVYGKTAGLLSGDSGAGDGLSGNDLEMYQAYVQYLAPLGEGVTFKAGKFATVIGAEVAQSPYNFNITRGHVYNLFQPITHTGVMASTEVGEGISLSLGVVNETRSFPGADIDLNNDKAVLWSIGYGMGDFSGSFNGAYGSSDSGQGDTRAGDKETILDLILSWDPTDDFSGYINADYIDSENSNAAGEFSGYGIAMAGRQALSDRLGVALRAEYVDLEEDGFGAASDADAKIWGLTGTLDYLLTEKLKLRGEVRYDNVRSSDDVLVSLGGGQNSFLDSGPGAALGTRSLAPATPPAAGQRATEDDQVTAGVEVIYSF